MYEHPKKKKKYLIISFVLSAICIVGLVLVTHTNLFITNTFLLWVLGATYLFLFLYFIFTKMIIKNLTNLKSPFKIISLSIVLTILILILLPIRYNKIIEANYLEKEMLQNNVIQIETIGEKNKNSTGYEIWIEGITQNDKDLNLYDISLDPPWKFVENRIFVDGKINTKIIIELNKNSTYQIMLRKQENAGKVKVKIGDNEYTYDLYSKDFIQRHVIDLSKIFTQNGKIESIRINRVLFWLFYFIIVFILLLSLLVTVYIKNIKKQNLIKNINRDLEL